MLCDSEGCITNDHKTTCVSAQTKFMNAVLPIYKSTTNIETTIKNVPIGFPINPQYS